MEKVETVLYVMADKFLDSGEMDELMEVIGMTRLGQKLINRGKEKGRAEGMAEGIHPLNIAPFWAHLLFTGPCTPLHGIQPLAESDFKWAGYVTMNGRLGRE